MKISNSKKQLAKIIHENGGWRDGNYAVQDKDDKKVWFMRTLAGRPDGAFFWPGVKSKGIPCDKVLQNWHQTILSRDEYFHLYQEHGLEAALDEPFIREESKPTIEQLASDYRNAKDYALRLQEEANDAWAAAEKAKGELIDAGKAHGLVLSVAPVQKYTGKFYNAELGEAPAYGKNTRDAVCDGCGKRYGEHYGDRCKSGSER